jgi:regulatory protein
MRRSGTASSADRTAALSSRQPSSIEGSADATPIDEAPWQAQDDTEVARVERSETREQSSSTSNPNSRGKRSGKAEPPDVYRQALGLLVRREHSRTELQRKLRARGADPVESAAALDTLRGQGYQDDARFAEMLIRTRIGGGYGPLHIRAELGTHRLDAEVAQQALLDAEPDWPALALQALQRRYGARASRDRAETVKRGQFLQRRGFDAASIRHALEHAAAG